ncbi:MAG: hypothetical protein PHQ26_05545 [Bacteroidales bacterium]|nr:hypothetical protein [Bacteroidales bacterium]
MKKLLLLVGLFVASFSLMAQEVVFEYGFEIPSGDLTIGKLDYSNFMEGDVQNPEFTDAHSGTKALQLQNAALEGADWQRALKFRNIPIDANTAYRVTFWVKGDNSYTLNETTETSKMHVSMMVGVDDADVPFVYGGNTPYQYTVENFSNTAWSRHSLLFFYTSDDIQKAYYALDKAEGTAELELEYFLKISAYTPGTYLIDDVSIVKSPVRSVRFNGDAIKVDLGYSNNGADLRAGQDYDTYSLPATCATVTLDGEPQEVQAVEIQPDGALSIYMENFYTEMDEGKIKVSFTYPEGMEKDLLYTGAGRPFSWDEEHDRKILSFTDEVAVYDMDISGSSIIYFAPLLKSATPENESFDLPLTTDTYTFEYNKNINLSMVQAQMVGPTGTFMLNLQESGEFSKTLTFKLPETETLIDGDYMITLTNVESDVFIPADLDAVVSFTIGEATGGTEIDTILVTDWKAQQSEIGAGIPLGWKRIWGTNIAESGSKDVGNQRMMYTHQTGGEFEAMMYMSPRGGTDTVRFFYGAYPDYRVHLTPGTYNISFNTAWWNDGGQNNNQKINFRMMDTTSTTTYYEVKDLESSLNLKDNNDASIVIAGSKLHSKNFVVAEEGYYILEWYVLSELGWDGIALANPLLTSVPSVAFVYKNKLALALNDAQGVLIAADSSLYDGDAKTRLMAAVDTYKDFSATAPSAYDAAVAELSKAGSDMATYKSNVDTYLARVQAAQTTLDTYTGTQYTREYVYPLLENTLNTYSEVDYSNSELIKQASDSLAHYSDLMKNWVNNAIPAMTYRMKRIVKLSDSLRVDSAFTRHARAITYDDDALADKLNELNTRFLYNAFHDNEIVFGNSWEDPALTDSLDMTGFIKNPNMYSNKLTQGLDNTAFPGWVTTGLEGGGIHDLPTATNPVKDSHPGFWNGNLDKFEQTITNLPVGVYNINLKTRAAGGIERSAYEDYIYSYIVLTEGDTIRSAFEQPGSWGVPANHNTSYRGVLITEGKLTIGFHTQMFTTSWEPTMFFGDPEIWMVGKDPNYVYEYTGQKQVELDSPVKEVQYFSIQGYRISRPIVGLNIVKTIYENGSTQVQKVMIRE